MEDAGDAVITWLGHTTSLTVSDITVTTTATFTGDPICGPDTCSGSCSKRKRSLSGPARQPDPRITGTPMISPRVVPAEPDPTYGFLDKPATGGLDAFANHFFASNPSLVSLDRGIGALESTYNFVCFNTDPVFFGVYGLYGCTSLILVSHCGVYMVSANISYE